MAEWIGCDGPAGRSRSGATVPKAKGTPGCPARAYVHAYLRSGEVHYCAHHGTEYMAELREQAVQIVDERARVLDEAAAPVTITPARKPSPAAPTTAGV